MHKKALHYVSEAHFRRGLVADFCPYGQPGDRLWVRENFGLGFTEDESEGPALFFRADWPDERVQPALTANWKSSRYMPRWASRLFLEVTDIRVERVQDISEEDSKAEGFAYREHFIRTWDEINERRGFSFEVDPWVRVIQFKSLITIP